MTELTLAQADAAKEAILVRAIDGETIDPAELEAADAAVARAKHADDLECARAKGAHQRAEKSAIDALAVKAKELDAAHEAAIDKRVAAAGIVDDRLVALEEALHDYHCAGIEVSATAVAMSQHNASIDSGHLMVTYPTLKAMQPSERPRCRRVEVWQPEKPEAKITVTEGWGFDRKERQIHSLEARTRTEHRRPHVKVDAA
jgi:hypothetical protein